MIIGISATCIELELEATAFDVLDKRHRCRIAKNVRSHSGHRRLAQRLCRSAALEAHRGFSIHRSSHTKHSSAHLQTGVSIRYRARAKKQQKPQVEKDEIHLLATSGKNEATISGMKDRLLDFSVQIRQMPNDHDF
ncbi:hypothetical protein FIBSPDRAFT_957262 [Athelia psychrophila]|uniref:Uncharacterized protein n=1 Tax=Athelia psychrophila TaxID=1759441 RepID=A0A166FWK0_9AGAM|nr:hypothetical protein FIBSPDRAFT_957262 [Fibularhizoctonia sp. CBS 109695]